MVGLTRPRLVGQPALSVDANLAPLRFPCGARGFFCGRSLVQPTKSRTFDERACWSAFAELATKSVKALSGRLAYPPPLMPLLTQGVLRALFLRVNWPPFRPDTRHNLEGLRLSSSTGLCLTTTNVSN